MPVYAILRSNKNRTILPPHPHNPIIIIATILQTWARCMVGPGVSNKRGLGPLRLSQKAFEKLEKYSNFLYLKIQAQCILLPLLVHPWVNTPTSISASYLRIYNRRHYPGSCLAWLVRSFAHSLNHQSKHSIVVWAVVGDGCFTAARVKLKTRPLSSAPRWLSFNILLSESIDQWSRINHNNLCNNSSKWSLAIDSQSVYFKKPFTAGIVKWKCHWWAGSAKFIAFSAADKWCRLRDAHVDQFRMCLMYFQGQVRPYPPE